MPKFHSEACPVLGYRTSRAVALTTARLRGRHVAVVAHQPATAGLSVLSGKRYYLIDRRLQTELFRIVLSSARTERRWLTVTADWWIHDPCLLLSIAPTDASLQLRHDITREVSALVHASPRQELLAIRRHVDEHLRGTTTKTAAGCAWRLTALRADAVPVENSWRADVDTWLHFHLRDSLADDPPSGRHAEPGNPG
ncbi:hypothetical protein [Amycolatopsis sp. A1MSW2902]|uniref:hypothetical protein n=1 Tax=Amycolatopsis sp. A1MSW2902 TaxID=687413 RepID=UPI00307D294A